MYKHIIVKSRAVGFESIGLVFKSPWFFFLVIAIFMQSEMAINDHNLGILILIEQGNPEVNCHGWSDSPAKILSCGPWLGEHLKIVKSVDLDIK